MLRIFKKSPLLLVGAIAVVLIAVATLFYNSVHFYGDEYDVLPTCTAEGGTYRKCSLCHRVTQMSMLSPSGHTQAWYTVKEATSATEGIEELRCSVCNILVESKRTPMKESPIPALYLHGSGDGMSVRDSILANFIYRSNDTAFENDVYAFVEADDRELSDDAQTEEGDISKLPEYFGEQSIGTTRVRLMKEESDYEKKLNYVLNDFQVGDGELPLFGDFGQSDEIRLYANNDDPTCVRRIVSYRQWRDLVAADYPDYARLILASDDTEYAGYNSLLYIRNRKPKYTFMGIYTISIPYSVLVQKNSDAGIRYVFHETNGTLQYIFGDDGEQNTAKESLESLLSADAATMTSRTDTDIMLAYYCFSQLTGNADAFTDIYWVSVDGTSWYPVPNNTEHTYGSRTGSVTLSDPTTFPEKSGVWKTLSVEYADKIRRRISELKRSRLSPQNVNAEFIQAVSKLDIDVYREDCSLNKVPFHDPNKEVERLIEWYAAHLDALTG